MAKRQAKKVAQANRTEKLSGFCVGVDLTAWTWSVNLQGFLIQDRSGVVRFSLIVREENERWIFTLVDNARQFEFLSWDESDGDHRQIETASPEFIRQVVELWRVDRGAACGVLWRQSQLAADDDETERPLWAC